MQDVEQIKKLLINCIKKECNWASVIKEGGNVWLTSLLTEMVEDYSEEDDHWSVMLSKCSSIEELLIVWGYINYSRGRAERSNVEPLVGYA